MSEIFLFFAVDKFQGDLYLTVKLLLPGVVKSVYNLNDKQIVKLFSRIFKCNQDAMVRDLEQVCELMNSYIFAVSWKRSFSSFWDKTDDRETLCDE